MKANVLVVVASIVLPTVTPKSSVHGAYIDHVSSRLYDIGRVSTGKASARRRFEDERSEHDGG